MSVSGRVGRDLIAENLRHLDRENAFSEHAFALDDEIVNSLETVEVDIPIHPGAGPNGRLGRIFRAFANFGRVFFADQAGREQFRDFFLHEFWLD